MARRGEPGRALSISLVSSSIGGLFGVAALMFLATMLKDIIYMLTDPEITVITAFGLVGIANIGSKNAPKSLISVLLGLLLGTIGLDPFSGEPRFTFGFYSLYDGFALVPVVIGLYAVTRVFETLTSGKTSERRGVENNNLKIRPAKGDIKKSLPYILFGSIIGTVVGIIPGLGGGPATVFAYNTAKGFKNNSETFGTGDPRGIAVGESANNAVVGGALIPFLTMGIAGSGSIAVAGSALIMHGIEPGATLMKNNPDLVYGLMWGLLCGCFLMFIFGILATSIFAKFLVIPDSLMAPILLFFTFAGAYVTRYFGMDIWMAIGVGVVAYFGVKLGYSPTNFIVAFILAKIFENSVRRSLFLSQGSWTIFLRSRICLTFIALIILVVAGSIMRNVKRLRATRNRANG
jgi:putative tricarboxylic transport membrane protein